MTRLGFGRLVIVMVTVFVVGPPRTASGESAMVSFPVTSYMGETITLTGKLTLPEGDGRFPALVSLHGCGGAKYDDYTSLIRPLVAMSYVVLQVDSFGPRGITGDDGVCDGTDWFKASCLNPDVNWPQLLAT